MNWTSQPDRKRRSFWSAFYGLGALAVIAILSITTGIVSGYHQYFPPDLKDGFLADKAHYLFSSPYGLAFYCHILAAPAAIFVGLLQFWPAIRQRHAQWHRAAGKCYTLLVLIFVTPGGLIMAIGTNWGLSVQACFVSLSTLTWFTTWRAWKLARQRQFQGHARWAIRSYTLMSSAIVLRLTDIPLRRMGLAPVISYNVCV